MASATLEHVVTTPHTNGVVAMTIKKFRLELPDEVMPGWQVDLRLNPSAEHYDMFLNSDEDVAWQGFGHIALWWNFGDEEGNALPLPKEGLKRDALPFNVLWFINRAYIDEFNRVIALPKRPEKDSNGTSQTDASKPADEKA